MSKEDYSTPQKVLDHLEVLSKEVLDKVEEELMEVLDTDGDSLRRAILQFGIRWIGSKTLTSILMEKGTEEVIRELSKCTGEADAMFQMILEELKTSTKPHN